MNCSKQQTKCPKCNVNPDNLHNNGCDIERCAKCGFQRISCDCAPGERRIQARLPWEGEWPGVKECREYGWYAVRNGNGVWESCDENQPNAVPDLNRLMTAAVWDPKLKRYIKCK